MSNRLRKLVKVREPSEPPAAKAMCLLALRTSPALIRTCCRGSKVSSELKST